MTTPMDPWKFMALVAQCATESQIELVRAFKFMAALTAAMQQSQGTTPTPPAPVTPPQTSSTVQ